MWQGWSRGPFGVLSGRGCGPASAYSGRWGGKFAILAVTMARWLSFQMATLQVAGPARVGRKCVSRSASGQRPPSKDGDALASAHSRRPQNSIKQQR